MRRINLDVNASYGLLPQVEEELRGFLSHLNPSSLHMGGQAARAAVEDARIAVAELIDLPRSKASKVIFTSGATEANNTAIAAAFNKLFEQPLTAEQRSGYGFLLSAYEHACVLEPAARLQRSGFSVHKAFAQNPTRGIAPSDYLNLVEGFKPVLVSQMLVNNETGQLFDTASIFAELRRCFPNIICHSDVVQALGKLEFRAAEFGADLLSISGHKIGALTGVGALVVNSDLEIDPLIYGGPQERRHRAGTENVLGIVSMGIAAKLLKQQLRGRIHRLQKLTEMFMLSLKQRIPEMVINNENLTRVPGVLNVRFPDVLAQDLLVALDLQGVLVSAGSACASGKPLPSHVLLALGLDELQARQSLRLSFAADISETELMRAADIISKAVAQQQSSAACPMPSVCNL
jgi:cysteine desulfurase